LLSLTPVAFYRALTAPGDKQADRGRNSEKYENMVDTQNGMQRTGWVFDASDMCEGGSGGDHRRDKQANQSCIFHF